MNVVSMTGFGRARGRLSERLAVAVVVRSVNHRYLDTQVRTNLRDEVPEIESVVRTVIEKNFERGRVTVQVAVEHGQGSGPQVSLDAAQIASVVEQLAAIPLPEGVAAKVTIGEVLAVPGLVTVTMPETLLDPSETERLRAVTAEAVAAALAMRRTEGEQIARQVAAELGEVRSFVDWFEPQIAEHRRALMERATERITALLGSVVDQARIAQEGAVLADRADVAEEIVRLRAHLDSFDARVRGGGAVGRTLDFLCQEIHRELNTLGSKCRELGVADRLVDAKSAAERVREQVQNLE
jgi:uncharacterized protein (TIGR00255 family)